MKSIENDWFSFKYIYTVIILGGLVLIYSSNEILPHKVPYIIFLPLIIPFAVLLNFLAALFSLSRKNYGFTLFYSLLFILFGLKYINRTFHFTLKENKEKGIKILSYNVRVFNSYAHFNKGSKSLTSGPISWVKNNDAKIVCLQEFYSNSRVKELNSVKILKKNYPFSKLVPYYDIYPQKLGLIILSKLKIINSGEVDFEGRTFNQAIYADIKLPNNKILRVYNVHLQSMNIDPKIFSGSKIEKNLFFTTVKKYENGVLERGKQVSQVLKHIKNCPYPVVVCGDFNDVPYSYVYEQFKDHLNNAFEKKGNGLGFTYSGKYSFLRIDNIFASEAVKINSFKTYDFVTWSDHFPVSANVSVEK